MLQVLYTSEGGPAHWVGANLWQAVDVSAFKGQRLCAASRWARVRGDAQTDDQFFIRMATFDGALEDYDARRSEITRDCNATRSCTAVYTQVPPETWTVTTASLRVSEGEGARWVMIGLNTNESIFNDKEGTEFDGHFIDDAVLFPLP